MFFSGMYKISIGKINCNLLIGDPRVKWLNLGESWVVVITFLILSHIFGKLRKQPRHFSGILDLVLLGEIYTALCGSLWMISLISGLNSVDSFFGLLPGPESLLISSYFLMKLLSVWLIWSLLSWTILMSSRLNILISLANFKRFSSTAKCSSWVLISLIKASGMVDSFWTSSISGGSFSWVPLR
jgi:hypothetical protein